MAQARAKKRAAKTVVIKAPGQKTISFKKGGLHKSLNVPQGQKIPLSKIRAALAGRYGPLAKKQAVFAEGMLKVGRATVAKRKRAK